MNYILPDTVNGSDVSAVTSKGSDISHARIHIGSPDGMPYSLCLLYNRLMVLRIFSKKLVPLFVSPFIKKEPG